MDTFEIDKDVTINQLNDRVKWQDLESAFNNNIRTGVIINLKNVDIVQFMKDAQNLFEPRIEDALKMQNNLKVYATLEAEYVIKRGDEEVIDVKYFNTKAEHMQPTTDIKEWFISTIQQPILIDMEEFQERDSGWTLYSILNLYVYINKYNPMRGGSYIGLPECIKRKKACVNVKNFDDKCFQWAVLSALCPPKDHSDRVQQYTKYENLLDFTGIEFPVNLKQISKFEKQNDISVNVYQLEENTNVIPVYITSDEKKRHVNLLLLQNYYENNESEKEEMKNSTFLFHYVWIKNLSRLVSSQLSKTKRKKYICNRCLHYFSSQEKLDFHKQDCSQINNCRVNLPEPDNNILQFKNFSNKEKVPFVIYADLECLLKNIQNNDVEIKNTYAYQKHEAFSIGYYLKCSYNESLSYYRSYRGSEPAKWFTKELSSLAEKFNKILSNSVRMETLTSEQKFAFENENICHICEKELENNRVRDHCHLTGRYRGAAHEFCNLNYKHSRRIPIILHNFSAYDSHFLIRDVAQRLPGKIDVLSLNKERFISFTKHIDDSKISFKFIDSYRFMASSLDKLSSYLKELPILKSEFSKHIPLQENQFQLLKRKGVFPYEYLNNEDKLNDVELPCKEAFYSSLNNCDISEEDYEHAKNVWRIFNISNLGQYSDLYLKTDVLLLADVFEHFRSNCINTYGLDPAHYYTTPGFTWDAMLRYTRIQLELLTDIDQMMFIERGIRGGISQCCNRYACANNKYMDNEYNADKTTKYLMYFDVNNLYGWAMEQPLPYGGFQWLENVDNIDFCITDDSPIGYILEVDLEYPDHIHDAHMDLPFCSEHSKPPNSSQAKLLTTLYAKSRYVLHYQNLKQALANGLQLTKIYRILKFNQKPWLKTYIDLNTNMRMKATNEFEKNLYKLMNNAVFGKTMENLRKRVDIKLVTKWKGRYGAEALIAQPNFHSRAIIDENLVLVEFRKLEVLMNKPIYVGLCVLDLSKTLVYEFHYNYMKKQFENNCKLLYTDTDSLIYEIQHIDIYEVMKSNIEKFDTSEYPSDNVFGMPQRNKKVVGLMKDECNGRIMTEFVGLRSKMYSIRIDGKDNIKKVKGVKNSVIQNTITFNDYVQCLNNMTVQTRNQCTIRSRKHEVFTERQEKLALSPHDDKRYLIADKTDTLPWGHYSIVKIDDI